MNGKDKGIGTVVVTVILNLNMIDIMKRAFHIFSFLINVQTMCAQRLG